MIIVKFLVTVSLIVGSLTALSCSKGNTQGTTTGSSSPLATSAPSQSSSTNASGSNAASSQDSNALTDARVHSAVQTAFNKLVRADKMAPGASSKVIGIQELPGVSGARADLDLTNAAFLQTDMLSGKWEVGPGGFGGRMVYSKKKIRIDKCTANLKHYNNGKWVLESLDTHSYEFGVVTVNVGVE